MSIGNTGTRGHDIARLALAADKNRRKPDRVPLLGPRSHLALEVMLNRGLCGHVYFG